jgi:hypothetical protein
MEKLFSKDDIREIEVDASSNLDTYWGGIVVNGQPNEKTIITISKNNQLIFVEGNSDSGYSHLRDRHGRFSFKNFWINTEDSVMKLDNPSKFHPSMMPIIDFVKIADMIYGPEYLNTAKNKKPDLFDMYTGYYAYLENEIEKYHLLTYKDTKIVHTLFPDNKKHIAKRKCKFGKGIVNTSLKFPTGFNDLLVPYENDKGVVKYSILVRKFYSEKIERLIIQRHNDVGEVSEQFFIAYRNFENFETFDREIMHDFQYGDLGEFEDIINQIDEKHK